MGKAFVRVLCSLWLLGWLLALSLGIAVPLVSADGGAPQLAYVAGTAQGMSVVDIAQRRVTGTFALGGLARMVLLSVDGADLYVAQPTLGRVSVVAAKTGKTLCAARLPGQPSLLALSIDATVLYAAGQGDTSVRALNPANCAVERTFETHEPVYGLAVAASVAANATPSTPNQLWIAGNSGLTVFAATGQLLGSAPVAGGPQYVSIPAGGLTAYVTTRQGSVYAVDLATRRVIRQLLNGGQYGPMDYNETTGEVYVPDHQHNLLDVLTPITASTALTQREPARQFPLSGAPDSIAITNDGQLGFVALANGQVLMLDIPGRSVVTSIAVGGTPSFIITGLYPPNNSSSVVPPSTPVSQPALSGNLLAFLILLALLCAALLGGLWFFWQRQRKA